MELQICDLSKKYGEKIALDKFSFAFRCGIYGIIGANGAGKTTLMNLITDTVKKRCGKNLWNGDDTLELGKKFRAIIGYTESL
jgi:ABC-type multidrug transport system ATPase subunit